MKIVVGISPYEACGIGEYGRHLNRAFEALGHEVIPISMGEQQKFLPAICDLVLKRPDNWNEAAQGAYEPTVPPVAVLIHFEPAIFRGRGLYRMLQQIRQAGRGVTVACTHYLDPNQMAVHEGLFDCWVIHRSYGGYTDDRNDTTVIPMGCQIFEERDRTALRQKYGLPTDRLLATTAGFLAEWKRFPEQLQGIIDRGDLLVRENAHVQFLCGKHFASHGDGHARQMETMLGHARPEVRERITFSYRFIPHEELLERVYASDIGFAYHGDNTGSVSAQTKLFVSGRCPLVITESSHASDMSHGVLRSSGIGLPSFLDALFLLIGDRKVQAQLREGMGIEYETRRMDRIAGLYLSLFEDLFSHLGNPVPYLHFRQLMSNILNPRRRFR